MTGIRTPLTLAYAVGVPGESFTVISKSFYNR